MDPQSTTIDVETITNGFDKTTKKLKSLKDKYELHTKITSVTACSQCQDQ